MKKINENTKVTLTLEQLKRLVKEGTDDPKNKYEPWEQALIDKIGHSHKAPGGCDCLGRSLSAGDWVVFLCAGSRFGAYKTLKVGKVLSVKSNIIIQTFEENWETNEIETDKTSRPPEYVFKIDDPQRVAGLVKEDDEGPADVDAAIKELFDMYRACKVEPKVCNAIKADGEKTNIFLGRGNSVGGIAKALRDGRLLKVIGFN